MMEIKPIKTRRDHRQALRRVDEIFDAPAGSLEEDELDILATLISSYEDKHFPIEPLEPIDVLLFYMEQQGLTRTDLEAYIGSSGRVSEVLSGRRGLSITMIRKLHTGLGIPLESLVGV